MKEIGLKLDKFINYKILLGFNYGSRRLYKSLTKKNYKEFKKYIKTQRKNYNKYYDFYKINQNVGTLKEKTQFIIMKYRLYFIYYLIKKYF